MENFCGIAANRTKSLQVFTFRMHYKVCARFPLWYLYCASSRKKGAAQPSSRHREAFYLGVLRACGVTRALGARRSASGALLFRKPRLELGSWFRAGTSTETVFGFFSCPTTSTSLLFSVFFVFVLVERKKNHVCQEFLSQKDIVVREWA